MWQTNQGLTDRHAYDSRPSSWPLLLRGINLYGVSCCKRGAMLKREIDPWHRRNSWVKDHRQIYLIGNPFVWALSTIAVTSFLAIRAMLIVRAQRGYKDFAHCELLDSFRICICEKLLPDTAR